MEELSSNHSPTSSHKTAVIAGVVIVLVIAAYAVFNKRSSATTREVDNTTATTTTTVQPQNTTVASTGVYKNGTYQAVGDYMSPEGPESIQVSLTLNNDIVTNATVTGNAFRPETKQYQAIFINNFQNQVIGKDIDQLHLTRVAGSSLTPKGFNDAVEKIKTQAQA